MTDTNLPVHERIRAEVRAIPKGKARLADSIAEAVGTDVKQVGRAMRATDGGYRTDVPWWRIVWGDHWLDPGKQWWHAQIAMLEAEGVRLRIVVAEECRIVDVDARDLDISQEID